MIANNTRIVAFFLAVVGPSLAFTTSSTPTQKTQLQLSTSDERSFQNRRSFLTNVVTTAAVLPSLVLSSPSSASAFGGFSANEKGPLVYGDDSIMSPKEHGTTASAVQPDLRYGVSNKLADKICSFNRVFAEMGGYFEGSTSFEKDVRNLVASTGGPVTFYDSVSGKPLFEAPKGRSVDEFIAESKVHGWPSFRDEEVVWDNVRVLRSSGETVSTVGTHLGHNLPDKNGNRYCINLVSIAGNPTSQ
jgi:peptide methionine sulfoxide reductase MsrB